jgi:hypothetical protein
LAGYTFVHPTPFQFTAIAAPPSDWAMERENLARRGYLVRLVRVVRTILDNKNAARISLQPRRSR